MRLNKVSLLVASFFATSVNASSFDINSTVKSYCGVNVYGSKMLVAMPGDNIDTPEQLRALAESTQDMDDLYFLELTSNQKNDPTISWDVTLNGSALADLDPNDGKIAIAIMDGEGEVTKSYSIDEGLNSSQVVPMGVKNDAGIATVINLSGVDEQDILVGNVEYSAVLTLTCSS